MRVRHLFLSALAVLACACTDNEQAGSKWDTASVQIEEPITSDDTLCYKIELKLDTLVGESELAKSLAAVLRDSVLCKSGFATVQAAMASYADSLQTEWKEELAEIYDPESDIREMFQYYYNVEGSPVETDNDNVLSYQVTTDCYLGGAHGSYVVEYYNFDKNTGKLISIRDIVPAEKEAEALKAMEAQLCEDWDAEDLAELQEMTGITMLGDLYLTNNFLLKKDSIEFLFNQYEIAPYAAGLISVTIPSPAIP